jgi:hypothetical protein
MSSQPVGTIYTLDESYAVGQKVHFGGHILRVARNAPLGLDVTSAGVSHLPSTLLGERSARTFQSPPSLGPVRTTFPTASSSATASAYSVPTSSVVKSSPESVVRQSPELEEFKSLQLYSVVLDESTAQSTEISQESSSAVVPYGKTQSSAEKAKPVKTHELTKIRTVSTRPSPQITHPMTHQSPALHIERFTPHCQRKQVSSLLLGKSPPAVSPQLQIPTTAAAHAKKITTLGKCEQMDMKIATTMAESALAASKALKSFDRRSWCCACQTKPDSTTHSSAPFSKISAGKETKKESCVALKTQTHINPAILQSTLAITGIDGLVQCDKLEEGFKKFLKSVIDCMPESESNLQSKLKESIGNLVAFFAKGQSIGSFAGFGAPASSSVTEKTPLRNGLEALLNHLNFQNLRNSGPFFECKCPMTAEFIAIQILARMNDVMQDLNALRSERSEAVFSDPILLKLGAADLGMAVQLETVETLRKHEMFYEFPLKEFDDNLVKAMVDALPGEALEQDCKSITKDQFKALAKYLLLEARKKDAGKREGEMCCGMRGRMKAPSFSKPFADRADTDQSFGALTGREACSLPTGSEGEKFLKRLVADGAFCSPGVSRPPQFACDGMLLDSRVDIINNPVEFLNRCLSGENVTAYAEERDRIVKAIKDLKEQAKDLDRQIKNLEAKLSEMPEISISQLIPQLPPRVDESAKDSMRKAMIAVKLPGQTETYKTVANLLDGTPPKYTSKPNLASLMKEHNLRTLCSVSGTTTDIVAALRGMAGKDKVDPALKSLRNFVAGGCKGELNADLKKLFLSIAMYMQAGQYHSAASVLCGLYSAALALGKPQNLTVDIDDYDCLLETFSSNPGKFFP